MMDELIRDISGRFEQSELLVSDEKTLSVDIKNGSVKEIYGRDISGACLRAVKNGRYGFNFTLGDSPGRGKSLAAGAARSAEFGPEAGFGFSGDRVEEKIPPGEPSEGLLDYCLQFFSFMKKKNSSIPLNIRAGERRRDLRIRTDSGGSCSGCLKVCVLHFSAPVPGGSSEVSRSVYSGDFFSGMPYDEAEDFVAAYLNSRAVSAPATGRMPVLFAPEALFFFVFCLQEGVSGRNLSLNVSPLREKRGEGLFSEKLVVADNPRDAGSPHSRGFDDEGVKTGNRVIVEKGVLENFIYDLRYAAEAGVESTGNGVKASLFSDGIGTPVSPFFINPVISPGGDDKDSVIKGLREGIIVENVMGFHSSNYTQGHFSMQAHGFRVSGGEIKGRLEDIMVAGNIYENFKNVSAVGDRLYCTSFGHAPYVLVDNISVSGG